MLGVSLQRLLGGEHEVTTVPDGTDALELLSRGKRYDVILCDLMMPNMTGMEFYEELLRLRPEMTERVVFLTGAVMTAKVATFLDTVPNRRVHKPFEVNKLRALVQELLGEREPA